MAGGIQKGNNSHFEGLSKSLDKLCKKVFSDLQLEGVEKKTCLPKEVIPGYKKGLTNTACEPDGGLWYKDGSLKLAVEMKVANGASDCGNAHERFFKNRVAVQVVEPSAKYILFLCGPWTGPKAKCKAYADLRFAMAVEGNEGFNVTHPSGLSVYQDLDGFSYDFIKNVTLEALDE